MRSTGRVIAALCFVASGDSLNTLDPVAIPLTVIGLFVWGLMVWASLKAKERQRDNRGRRR